MSRLLVNLASCLVRESGLVRRTALLPVANFRRFASGEGSGNGRGSRSGEGSGSSEGSGSGDKKADGSDTPKDWPILANASYEIEIPLPEVKKRVEDVETTRARLVYQSRKRGMAENDILISTFAKQYLPDFTVLQLCMYDDIINKPSNDWDLYYWMTGASPIPMEYNNEVMDLMVEHAKNTRMEVRISQPPLEPGKMMLGYDPEEEKQ